MKKVLAVLIALTLCLSFAACGEKLEDIGKVMDDAIDAVQNPDGEKTFTNAGVTFTLNSSFLDYTGTNVAGDYIFLYASDAIGLLGVQESKQELFATFEEMDLEGYANLIAQLYSLNTAAQQKDGFWYLTYETEADGVNQTFVCVFHETEEDYWNLQGYCASDIYAEHAEDIWKYLTTVTFQ